MVHSWSIQVPRQCPSCGRETEFPVWGVVDVAERPDLVTRLCAGELDRESCPRCGTKISFPAGILLLYRPGQNPPVFLATAGEPPEVVAELGSELMGMLREGLGEDWDPALAAAVPAMDRARLERLLRLERRALKDVEPDYGDSTIAELAATARETSPLSNPTGFAFLHSALGELYGDRLPGGLAKASERAIHHLSMASEATDPDDVETWAGVQTSLSYAYLRRTDGDHEENFEKAIAHARAAADAYPEASEARARALTNYGRSLVERTGGDRAADAERAIAALEEAVEIFATAGQASDRAIAEANLAFAYSARLQGDPVDNANRSLAAAERAVAGFLAVGADANAAMALMNLGNAYALRRDDRGRYLRLAIDAYEHALALAPERGEFAADLHMNAGNAHRDLALHKRGGAAAKWRSHYDMALEIFDALPSVLGRARALENSGIALVRLGQRQRDQVEGRHRLGAAADVFIRIGAVREAFRVLEVLGRHLCEDGAWADAVEAFARAADINTALLADAYTETGQLSMVGKMSAVSSGLAYALLKLGRPADALVRLEQGKTRLFRNAPRPRDAAEILALAPPGGVLVVPLVTRFGGAVFVLPHGADEVSADHVVWLGELDDGALQGLLLAREFVFPSDRSESFEALLGAVSDRITLTYVAETEEELERLLWIAMMGSVDNRVREGAPVVIVPHGGIGLLPWHAARPKSDAASFVDRHPVSYAPSASILADSASRQRDRRPDNRLLVFSDPTGDLPYAVAEAVAVSAPFPPGHATVLIRAEADAASFVRLSGTASYLHLACHAVYDWESAMRSALLLAGSDPFTLADMADLPRTDEVRLVSLSGCETGVSRAGGTADEYLGFPMAFHRAGFPLVLSTLWPVADSAAVFLSGRFYERLIGHGDPPDEALRVAQRWLRDASRRELIAWLDMRGRHTLETVLLKEKLRDSWPPDERPFRSLGDWAAFTLSGHCASAASDRSG